MQALQIGACQISYQFTENFLCTKSSIFYIQGDGHIIKSQA